MPKICDAGGITKDGIGAIRVRQDLSYVQIAAPLADRFGDFIEISDEVTMRRMEGEPQLDAPVERAPRPSYRDKPAREDRPARKPAPRKDATHDQRVKSAKGGWVPDDAPMDDPRPAVKPWKKKTTADGGAGKPAWAKPKPRADKAGGPKPHRKGPKRPS